MITNIIIVLLIAIKAFLLAFILCDKFGSIMKGIEKEDEVEDLSNLKREHISLTESEDEDEEIEKFSDEIIVGKKVIKTASRAVLKGTHSKGLKHSVELIEPRGERGCRKVRFFTKVKNCLKGTNYFQNCKISKSIVNCAKKVSGSSNEAKINSQISVPSSNSIKKKERHLNSRKKLKNLNFQTFDPRRYKSRRGVKIAQSWVRYSLHSKNFRSAGRIEKLRKKINKLNLNIARKRNVLRFLPMISEVPELGRVLC